MRRSTEVASRDEEVEVEESTRGAETAIAYLPRTLPHHVTLTNWATAIGEGTATVNNLEQHLRARLNN